MKTYTKIFFLFWVDFPELLNCLSFTKRGLPFVFTPKIPHHRLPEILVCLWWGRAVSALSSDCQISRMGSLTHFLTHGLPLRALRPRSSAINFIFVYFSFWTLEST